ncbi:MAG: helix-turn-helix transcriptional regulator [Bacillota bacterium]
MLKTIIETIRIERLRRKMTLKELSVASTVSVKQICDIENEKANPSLNTLDKLARPLGLKIKVEIVSEAEG